MLGWAGELSWNTEGTVLQERPLLLWARESRGPFTNVPHRGHERNACKQMQSAVHNTATVVHCPMCYWAITALARGMMRAGSVYIANKV
jgi:hypothetical protein